MGWNNPWWGVRYLLYYVTLKQGHSPERWRLHWIIFWTFKNNQWINIFCYKHVLITPFTNLLGSFLCGSPCKRRFFILSGKKRKIFTLDLKYIQTTRCVVCIGTILGAYNFLRDDFWKKLFCSEKSMSYLLKLMI